MSKQTLVVVVGAIVLLGLGIVGAMAFTGGGGSGSPALTSTGGAHTMQDGQTMTGMDMTP